MKKIAICVAWGDTTNFLNSAYIDYISAAGMEPILVSPHNNMQRVAEDCDGLLLPGGIDLDPTFYGDENYSSYNCDPARDNFERKALLTFINAGKPVFGICRGFQLIVNEFIRANTEAELDLWYTQHVEGHSLASDRHVGRGVHTHSVSANTGKMYSDKDEVSRIFVNSIHHQALMVSAKTKEVKTNSGDILKIMAVTAFGVAAKVKDVIVEGVDVMFKGARVRAVQWHPEELKDVALLANFFEGVEANVEKENRMVG